MNNQVTPLTPEELAEIEANEDEYCEDDETDPEQYCACYCGCGKFLGSEAGIRCAMCDECCLDSRRM